MPSKEQKRSFVDITLEQPLIYYGVAEIEDPHSPILIDGNGVPVEN